jgi:hypothetical protein
MNDVLGHWRNLPIHHGGIHDLDIWHYAVNEKVHGIDMHE